MSEPERPQPGALPLLRGVPYPQLGWGPVHRASFGLIYGSILVLSLLMAMDEAHEGAFRAAVILFGSVLAVTLARSFAEILSNSMETGERMLTRKAFRTAWRRSHPTLTVANVATALFLAAGLGWLTVEAATVLSRAFCVGILVVLGARVGWVIHQSWWLPIGGALFAGALGTGLAFLKYAIH